MKTNTISTKSTRRFNNCMKALYRAMNNDTYDDCYDDDNYQEAFNVYYMGHTYAVIA